MDHYAELIEQSYLSAVEKVGETGIAEIVFDRFFESFPETRTLFDEETLSTYFGRFKIKTIYEFFMDVVKYPDYGQVHFAQEFLRHDSYGLRDKEYFFVLLDCFVMAIKQSLGPEWNADYETAWNDVCMGMKPLIQEAAQVYQ